MDSEFLDQFRGGLTADEPCPYLPDRSWRSLIVDAGPLFSRPVHEFFLEQGFRRMGQFVYRPVCVACRECRPLRIDVTRFQPNRSQRRTSTRNSDVRVEIVEAEYNDERRDLLARYLDARHEGPMTAQEGPMRQFMYDTPGDTVVMDYRIDGRLVGSGIVDILESVVSSIYFFFEPEESRRSLGIYSMLCEIELARHSGRRWFHPGFYISQCAAMNYKSLFRPCEVLGDDGVWRALPER